MKNALLNMRNAFYPFLFFYVLSEHSVKTDKFKLPKNADDEAIQIFRDHVLNKTDFNLALFDELQRLLRIWRKETSNSSQRSTIDQISELLSGKEREIYLWNRCGLSAKHWKNIAINKYRMLLLSKMKLISYINQHIDHSNDHFSPNHFSSNYHNKMSNIFYKEISINSTAYHLDLEKAENIIPPLMTINGNLLKNSKEAVIIEYLLPPAMLTQHTHFTRIAFYTHFPNSFKRKFEESSKIEEIIHEFNSMNFRIKTINKNWNSIKNLTSNIIVPKSGKRKRIEEFLNTNWITINLDEKFLKQLNDMTDKKTIQNFSIFLQFSNVENCKYFCMISMKEWKPVMVVRTRPKTYMLMRFVHNPHMTPVFTPFHKNYDGIHHIKSSHRIRKRFSKKTKYCHETNGNLESCCMRRVLINLDEWGDGFRFIIAPRSFYINVCDGGCHLKNLPTAAYEVFPFKLNNTRPQHCCRPFHTRAQTFIFLHKPSGNTLASTIMNFHVESCSCL
ncbi:hypothetical protein SNEBB_001316 [Seison nebaliae]|nr:hypothetical protein SNEBB_001316 [Seison nebaliae]